MAIKAIADAIPKLAIQGKQFALPESFIGWPAREKRETRVTQTKSKINLMYTIARL